MSGCWAPREPPQVQQLPQGGHFAVARKGPPVAGVDGNWACVACGNVNFAQRDVCNICQLPWAPAQTKTSGGKGAPVAGIDGNWLCPACNNVNFGTRNACNRCGLPKPIDRARQSLLATAPKSAPMPKPKSVAPVAGVDGNWLCTNCGNVNFGSRDMCNRCNMPRPASPEWQEPTWQGPDFNCPNVVDTSAPKRGPPIAGVDGNWACGLCGNVNFASRVSCNMCQAPQGGVASKKRTSSVPGAPVAQFRERGQAPVAGVNGNWQCAGLSLP